MIIKNRSLNPFAFPLETNALFTLFIVSVVLWMLELGQIIGVITIPDMMAIVNFLNQGDYVPNQGFISSVLGFIPSVVLTLSVFLLALLIYLTHPTRLRYAKHSRPITRNDDPKFFDAILELSNLSHISHLPNIEIDPNSLSANGQVFGLWKNHVLRLNQGLRLLFRQDSERFRAIILHELAHIANGDIARSYLTQAIWSAVIALTIIPVLLLTARFFFIVVTNFSAVKIAVIPELILLIKIGCILLILAVLRRNILQSRELYADHRAAKWSANAGLIKILQQNMPAKNQKKWMGFWSFHPAPRERLETLQNPNSLFQIKPALPLFLGILLGLTIGGLFSATDLFIAIIGIVGSALESIVGIHLPEWSVYLMILGLISPLIMILTILFSNCLGIAVQRETIANMANGQDGLSNYFNLGKEAILIAIGFQAGSFLTVSSMLDLLPSLLKSLKGFFSLSVMMSLTIFLVCSTSWLVLIYLRFFARRLLGTHASMSPPKAKIHILSLISSLILMCFYTPIFFLQGIAEGVITERGNMGVLGVVLLVIMIAIFFLYGFLFIATWLFVGIYNLFHPSLCPTCGHIIENQYSVGKLCNNCGIETALWLYSKYPS